MSLELLNSNIKKEKELIIQIENLFENISKTSDKKNIKLFQDALDAKMNQIKILNKSIDTLLENISLIKKMTPQENKGEYKDIISLKNNLDIENIVAINKKDKKEYINQLHISQVSLKRIKYKDFDEREDENYFKEPNPYVVISNKLFSSISRNLVNKGYFDNLRIAIKKGDFAMLIYSYVSVILFTTLISLFASIFLAIFFSIFKLSIDSPFILLIDGGIIERIKYLWIFPLIPIFTFITMYLYPYAEKSSIEQNIEYELPFVTIHMTAIASSNIEPSNIFKIIALGKEYPYVKKEAKKIMNQINLYGYDLVTALRNVALASSSKAWSDLLNGISTTIKSGGDLTKYLEKKSEGFMFEYQLKREKAIKSAETFMDIYISVSIAGPMLLMMLLILISITQLGFSLPVIVLSIVSVAVVSIINIIFLTFLQLNQKRI